jgi:hypothetical protein
LTTSLARIARHASSDGAYCRNVMLWFFVTPR